MTTTIAALALLLAQQAKPLEREKDGPILRMLQPGFAVRELPIQLTNLNNVAYDPAGRLFAAGYDGRLHVIIDSDGDGLEDRVATFVDKPTDDYPMGLVARADGLYVTRRHAVIRHRDTDGDGVPDAQDVAAEGWRDPRIDADPAYTHRRIDDAIGLAVAPDGTVYVATGSSNYSNAYQLGKDGKSRYRRDARRGVVLRIPPGRTPEVVATGVRYLVSMQFNGHGDLFATDQEGATWMPNGNPFDELLHLQSGRHYGFPPRHPVHLPDVIDEPSVFDYAPQHQSTCGFRFNDGPARFGPASWDGDAIVTAMSRGKLYRTAMVKTNSGYVARTDLIGVGSMLPIDCALSPKGELVVACHSGAPDWGSGPQGAGKLFKIAFDSGAPTVALVYPRSETETVVAFERPVDPPASASIEGGRAVDAGDRFESYRPGYQVVKAQLQTARFAWAAAKVEVEDGGRSIVLRTAPRTAAVRYAVTLPGIDAAHDLTGATAEWKGATSTWTGWLPHLDLVAARGLTRLSAAHDRLWEASTGPGTLRLRATLDLRRMLRPDVQEGARLDAPLPPETVTLRLRSGSTMRVTSDGREERTDREARITSAATRIWVEVELETGGGGASLDVSWSTAEDARPRALPLRRILVPWAVPEGAAPVAGPREIPEIAGGDSARGRSIFFGDRAACSKCHAIRGEGGKIAPDLSNLVHRDYASVLKDIAQPSAAINPDYLAYRVRLKSGDVLAGVATGGTAETLTLGLAAGETATVRRADIDAQAPSTISLMPEGLLQGLDERGVKDLMAFLLKEK